MKIELDEIKKLKIKENEALLIKMRGEHTLEVAKILGEKLKCKVFIVDEFDNLKVVSCIKGK